MGIVVDTSYPQGLHPYILQLRDKEQPFRLAYIRQEAIQHPLRQDKHLDEPLP